ncbi:MAG: purine-nucleoside phosphorylase [Acidobacteriota bacterium]
MGIFEKIQEAKNYIDGKTSVVPETGIVLGSGLGEFADFVENKTVISYGDIPNFKNVSVKGHAGNLVLGEVKGKKVVVLQGRYHFYEGHEIGDVVFPVRVIASLGIKNLILTNAAGGIKENFTPGDLMIITDHINLMATNPLTGKNDERLGPRFPDMSSIYSRRLSGIIEEKSKILDIDVRSGVYAGLKGPSYETPAEIRMLSTIGADAVGMSTVPESIAARHMGVEIAGISCITNMAAGISKKPLDHKEVTETADRVKNDFIALLNDVVPEI